MLLILYIMLYKKFGAALYAREAPEYKTYQTNTNQETLLITKNYTLLKQGKDYFLTQIIIVGDGATSVVVKACRGKDVNDTVAIKKVKRVFDHTAFAHRAMRELRILRCLAGHDNVKIPTQKSFIDCECARFDIAERSFKFQRAVYRD